MESMVEVEKVMKEIRESAKVIRFEMSKGVVKNKVSLDLHSCLGPLTGVGNYTFELAKRLHSGNRIEYQGNVFNHFRDYDTELLKKNLSYKLSESVFIPQGAIDKLPAWFPFGYSDVFGRSDITHFFQYVVPPKVKGKIVNTIYDMVLMRFPETMEKGNYEVMKNRLFSSIERSNRLITISEFSKREIIELTGYPKEKIDIVYPAASISNTCADRKVVLEKYNITKPFLLFVGSIEPRKNLERLIQAFCKFKSGGGYDGQLVLCGASGWKNERIHEAAETSPYSHDIIFTGYVTVEERNALYKNASAFVFPSIYEGFGIPPLEAMYWGCPVICSNAASLPEVGGDSVCYVDPYSEEDIAEGIDRVLNDREYEKKLVISGKEQCRKFSWDTSAKALEAVYCKMCVE